jgi:hypothetical protein
MMRRARQVLDATWRERRLSGEPPGERAGAAAVRLARLAWKTVRQLYLSAVP